jgi:predicted AlkP superfamily phosphohydrolase/phosphomutase
MTRAVLAVLLLDLCWSASASGDGRPKKKVLIIGIDGCRTDALLAAKAPNLYALIRAGAFADKTRIISPRPAGVADTISGPGWSSILTGVSADKHGVRDNQFQKPNFKDYPNSVRHTSC